MATASVKQKYPKPRRAWAALVKGSRSSWVLLHTVSKRRRDAADYFDHEDFDGSIEIVRVVVTVE